MIYEPREDTYLLKNYLEGLNLEEKKVLEIGTGSGIIAKTMNEKEAEVTATDKNTEALENLPEDIKALNSDLFEEIDEKYDLVVFNPPYLPGNSLEDEMQGSETWYGGENGVEVAKKFLEACPEYLKEGGEALIILSSLSDYESLIKEFDLIEVDREKLFFEELMLMNQSLE